MTILQDLPGYEAFRESILARMADRNVDVPDLFASHLAYRTQTREDYDRLFEKCLKHASVVSRAMVSGREISVFMLNDKPEFAPGQYVEAFELVAPKPGSRYPGGLQHVGFVPGEKLDDFVRDHVLGDIEQNNCYREAEVLFEDGLSVRFRDLSMREIVLAQGSVFQPVDEVLNQMMTQAGDAA